MLDNHHRRHDRDEEEGDDGGDSYVADDNYGGRSDIYINECYGSAPKHKKLRTSANDDDRMMFIDQS